VKEASRPRLFSNRGAWVKFGVKRWSLPGSWFSPGSVARPMMGVRGVTPRGVKRSDRTYAQVDPQPLRGRPHPYRPVELAVAEAVSWLVSQGLSVEDPSQPAARLFALARRAATVRNRTDLEAYRKGRMLPVELLQPALAERVLASVLTR
jgi:hypothetical protein